MRSRSPVGQKIVRFDLRRLFLLFNAQQRKQPMDVCPIATDAYRAYSTYLMHKAKAEGEGVSGQERYDKTLVSLILVNAELNAWLNSPEVQESDYWRDITGEAWQRFRDFQDTAFFHQFAAMANEGFTQQVRESN